MFTGLWYSNQGSVAGPCSKLPGTYATDPRSNQRGSIIATYLVSFIAGPGISSGCYMEYVAVSSAQPEVVPTLQPAQVKLLTYITQGLNPI